MRACWTFAALLAACGGAAQPSGTARTATTASSGAETGTTMVSPQAGTMTVQQLQGHIEEIQQGMGETGECRDLCRGSRDICVAAHEICALTGDGDAAAARDERCTRARNDCDVATRNLARECPVCPQ